MDLSTRYMGLNLKNPLVASASPLTADLSGIRRLEDAGVAAVVLPSLFEEQIHAETSYFEHLSTITSDINPDGPSYFPELDDYRVGPDKYLELIAEARKAVDIPVIASLNGMTEEGWLSYAKLMVEAGASGLELNVYFLPTDITKDGHFVEKRYLDILKRVKETVRVPVAIKLSPYFSSIGNMAVKLDKAGADALVLFNRFYQPDIRLSELEVLTDLKLSEANEIRLPLLWLGVLSGQVKASLAATSGVTSPVEVAKYLLVGADVVMATSALLRHGPGYAKTLIEGLVSWLSERDATSVNDIRGLLSHSRVSNPQAYERANYIKILQSYAIADTI